jgi:chemotaxis protein CheD
VVTNVRPVGIGEIIVSREPLDSLVIYGLGSCVAVCLYEPSLRLGGMLHALLPSATTASASTMLPAKYVDQGIPLLLEAMRREGAKRSNVVASLCGGAQILSATSFRDLLTIGARNVLAAEESLRRLGLPIQRQETGGRSGRTVMLMVGNGELRIKALAESTLELA